MIPINKNTTIPIKFILFFQHKLRRRDQERITLFSPCAGNAQESQGPAHPEYGQY